MSDFKIKDFNSTIPRDTEFFRVLTERTLEKIPKFKPILNPDTDDFQIFIALVQRLSYSFVDFPKKSNIIHNWITSYYYNGNNFGLTVAVWMIMDGQPRAFFEAGNLDKEVYDTLIELIQKTFAEVYDISSTQTELFSG